MMKRILSIFLVAILCLSYLPIPVLAAEKTCSNHPTHEGCSYQEAIAEQVCSHVHDANCTIETNTCLHNICDESCSYAYENTESYCRHKCSTENGCIRITYTCEHSADGSCCHETAQVAVACDHRCELCDPINTIAIIDSGTCGTNLTWVLNNLGELTISGTGDMDSYYATYLAPWNEHKNSIESIIIEPGVGSIGLYAFYDCTKVVNVSIPSTVITIWDYAFYGCSSLKNVLLSEGITSIEYYAFYGCSSLTNIIIPSTVENIGYSSFHNCSGLEEITIPSAVTNIGKYAFYNCIALKQVTFLGDAPIMENGCFYEVTATIIYPAENETYTDSVKADYEGTLLWVDTNGVVSFGSCGENLTWMLTWSETEKGVLSISGEGDMENYAYASAPWYDYRKLITTIVISDGVTSIGDYTFHYCTALTSIVLPNSVTTINYYAFNNCTFLQEINLPTSLTTIGERAFYTCSSLKEITVPETVTTIGKYAFNCRRLTQITFLGDAPAMESQCFYNVTATAYYPGNNITWTSSVMKDYGGAITWEAKCINGHSWKDATCETPKTCSVCGETEGEVLEHEWTAATCMEKAKCSICDMEYGELAAHTLCKIDAVAATCTGAGNREYYTCTVCGKYYSDADGETEITKDSWVLPVDSETHSSTSHTYIIHEIDNTHTKQYTCCGMEITEEHDFSAGICVCGAHEAVNADVSITQEAGKITTAAQNGLATALGKKDIWIEDDSIVSVSIQVRKNTSGRWWQWNGRRITYDHTITFEGKAEGSTVVKVGEITYNITVTKPTTFMPEYFTASIAKSSVAAGKPVILTVKTSKDVEYVTINGEKTSSYKTVVSGWGRHKTTYHIFTYIITENTAGQYKYMVYAYNSDGLISEAARTLRLTVTKPYNRLSGFWKWWR